MIFGFQSTPPVWAETKHSNNFYNRIGISIHSARVGGDLVKIGLPIILAVISIHSARVGGDSKRNHFFVS